MEKRQQGPKLPPAMDRMADFISKEILRLSPHLLVGARAIGQDLQIVVCSLYDDMNLVARGTIPEGKDKSKCLDLVDTLLDVLSDMAGKYATKWPYKAE